MIQIEAINGCIAAARLSTPHVFETANLEQKTATHFACLSFGNSEIFWDVKVSLRSEEENYILDDLHLSKLDFDNWEGDYESLLELLLTKFNENKNRSFSF